MEAVLITVKSILITAALICVPAYIIFRIVKRADGSTAVYTPEEVTDRLRRGFLLSGWGIDLTVGAVLLLSLILCRASTPLKLAAPIGSLTIGLILLLTGRVKVGLMTRYINFCSRERTEQEKLLLKSMLEIEDAAMRANAINQLAKLTPGAADNAAAAAGGMGSVSAYMAVGRIYTGRNALKNHWPLILIALICAASVIITLI